VICNFDLGLRDMRRWVVASGRPRGYFCCGLILLGSLLVAGCSQSGPAVAPVSGRVTLDGKALPGVSVTFQPSGQGTTPGTGSFGRTDADGRYTLQLISPNGKASKGAVVGKHTVTFAAASTEGSDAGPGLAENPIPPKYQKGIPFEVPPGGTDKADFALTSQ